MRIWCLVGCKTGDCINCLQPIYAEYKRTNEIQHVMVAEKYASLFSGCSYVKVVKWFGEWHDLKSSIIEAKKLYEEVITLSTFGKDWPIEKKTPSFALDQIERSKSITESGISGVVFQNISKPFDERSKLREYNLCSKIGIDSKTILFADTSESSKFSGIIELQKILYENFTENKIVKLSEIKADFFYDMIGVYDKAACLVSIETSHLHLSASSDIPVIALVTDRPEIWHGTAYRPQFVIHCRYSDFDMRKGEIINAILDSIIKKSKPEVEILTTDGYNPTMIGDNLVYRFHPDPSHWRTELALRDGTNIFLIKPPKGFEGHSIEDARGFTFNGKPYISYTVGRTTNNQHRCVIQYGELVNRGTHYQIENHFQPKYGKNDFSGTEKNWSYWETDGKLYCAYQRSPEQIVLQIEGDKVVKEYRTKSPVCSFGDMRGGTHPIPYKDGMIKFFHTNRINRKSAYWWLYSIGALVMDSKPPFAIRQVSSSPIFVGNEQYFPDWKFWKPKVAIPYGAVKKDDEFHVSIGLNDSACAILKLKEEHLNL